MYYVMLQPEFRLVSNIKRIMLRAKVSEVLKIIRQMDQ